MTSNNHAAAQDDAKPADAVSLNLAAFREPGLYLLFADGQLMTLTHSSIHEMTDRYLADPVRIPPHIRQAAQYQLCSICPKRHTATFCHAIPTVFPLLDHVDRFLSHDPVTAAFRADPDPDDPVAGMLHVVQTTMQRALQQVSILSLIHYCEVGQTYFKYFSGVIPFMNAMAIAERVYLNIFWDLHGDVAAVDERIATMRGELDHTVRCQVERLRLICRNDAFINAFVNTHIATQFLAPELLPELRARFSARRAPESC